MNVKIRDIKAGDGGSGGSGKGGAGADGGRGGDVNIFNKSPPSIFEVLNDHVVWSARYDSAQRIEEHAVTCQPETQTRVLEEIRSWADSTASTLCWLSGPAGTGKTTVAHTIAEEYNEHGRLAATFFFWRKTGDRDNIHRLVATLAWQIANTISFAKERMEEAMELKNKAWVPLPSLSLEDQLSKLLVRGPVANVNAASPDLIIIDGLDECVSQEGIRRLIDWLRRNNPPFRFLLTSRPEPQIEACFQPGDGRTNVLSISLTESKDDIRKYFVKELEKIKRERLSSQGPSDWPPKSSVDKLVEKSEGLFVYAATAVRYIGGKGDPKKRLADVLKLHKGLDPLYVQVIEEAKKWDYCNIVMGTLMHLRYPPPIDELSMVLLLESDVIRFALGGCHSIIIVPRDNTEIKFHHASLRDFLTDQSRSNTLFYNPAMSHGQLMVGCLRAITRSFSDGSGTPEYALISWHHHASLFLGAGEGLEGLEDEAEELVKKIDLKWVKVWMAQALQWASGPYLARKLTQEKPQGQAKRNWTQVLERKLRSISGILQKFVKYYVQQYGKYVDGHGKVRDDVAAFFKNKKFKLLPNMITLEGSIILAFKDIWK